MRFFLKKRQLIQKDLFYFLLEIFDQFLFFFDRLLSLLYIKNIFIRGVDKFRGDI